MRQVMAIKSPINPRIVIVTAVALLALPGGKLIADDFLGMYVGGAVGQSQVAAGASYPTIANLYPGEFKEDHSAFKVMAGIRPISLVGLELTYIDFGHPRGNIFSYPADATLKGAAAFGILYLPVPVIDLYLKAGAARLQSTLRGFYAAGDNICVPGAPCGTTPFQLNRTNTSGAGGVGAQYKFGSWAVRAEYERFNAAGGNPSMLSAGITWTFF
jgi:outer membrane protein with beta-barrel domain